MISMKADSSPARKRRTSSASCAASAAEAAARAARGDGATTAGAATGLDSVGRSMADEWVEVKNTRASLPWRVPASGAGDGNGCAMKQLKTLALFSRPPTAGNIVQAA